MREQETKIRNLLSGLIWRFGSAYLRIQIPRACYSAVTILICNPMAALEPVRGIGRVCHVMRSLCYAGVVQTL